MPQVPIAFYLIDTTRKNGFNAPIRSPIIQQISLLSKVHTVYIIEHSRLVICHWSLVTRLSKQSGDPAPAGPRRSLGEDGSLVICLSKQSGLVRLWRACLPKAGIPFSGPRLRGRSRSRGAPHRIAPNAASSTSACAARRHGEGSWKCRFYRRDPLQRVPPGSSAPHF